MPSHRLLALGVLRGSLSGNGDSSWRPDPHVLSLPAAFIAGSVPWSEIASMALKGVDLRDVGSGTVSGTGLNSVAGFTPLAVVGILEVGKGAVGPLLAGKDRPVLAAACCAAGVAGHNWSPFLGGAGGRGLSPAIGALLVMAPLGAITLLAGLTFGRLAGETAIGSLIAAVATIPVSAGSNGRGGALASAGIVGPMLAKRILGNHRPMGGDPRVYLYRLLLDRDTIAKATVTKRAGIEKTGALV